MFLCGLKRREEAMESALVSIAGYPWNWSAWTLLGSCIGDGEEVPDYCAYMAPDLLWRTLTAILSAAFASSSRKPSARADVSSENSE